MTKVQLTKTRKILMRKLSPLKSHNRKGMNSSWMIAPRQVTPIAKPANNFVTRTKHTRFDDIERLTCRHVNAVAETFIFISSNIIKCLSIVCIIIVIVILYRKNEGSVKWEIGTALLAKELCKLDYPIAKVKIRFAKLFPRSDGYFCAFFPRLQAWVQVGLTRRRGIFFMRPRATADAISAGRDPNYK